MLSEQYNQELYFTIKLFGMIGEKQLQSFDDVNIKSGSPTLCLSCQQVQPDQYAMLESATIQHKLV